MQIQKSFLLSRTFSRRLYLGTSIVLLAGFLLCMLVPFYSVYTASAKKTPLATWHTFHDPVYGFSLSYPGSWILTTESDNSHITLLRPATKTTMSPIVTTLTKSVEAVLNEAPPARATSVQKRTVAGYQAVDYLLPYMPGSQMHGADALISERQQTRLVIVPVPRAASVYTFMLTQLTNASGKTSATEQSENTTFEAILNSFTPPTSTTASTARQAHIDTAHLLVYKCDRVCWADANWNYNYYDDSSGPYAIYCDNQGYNSSYSTNPGCIDGNVYGAQVPSSGLYFQPNFQCADFVSRALTQDGLLPGLNNGGVNGSSPASDTVNAYANYHAANGNIYHLWNVGVTGYRGLHDYLLDSGLATNIHQNVQLAQPGDVVFLIDSNGSYYHTMIIVAVNNGSIYVDAHNRARYHSLMDSTMLGTSGFDIYHLKSTGTYPGPLPGPWQPRG